VSELNERIDAILAQVQEHAKSCKLRTQPHLDCRFCAEYRDFARFFIFRAVNKHFIKDVEEDA
jgi:hypothetical protein